MLNDFAFGEDPEANLEDIFDTIIDDAVERAGQFIPIDNPEIYVRIGADNLGRDIWLPPRPLNQNCGLAILNEIKKVAQSATEANLFHTILRMKIVVMADNTRGRGPSKDLNFFGVDKKALILVNNRDKFCLFYAAELSRLHKEAELWEEAKEAKMSTYGLCSRPLFTLLIKHSQRQKELVEKFLQSAKIDTTKPSFGYEDYGQIQEYYDKKYKGMYRLVVISEGTLEPIYAGPRNRRFVVPIYKQHDHFHGIRKLNIFLGVKYYCVDCASPFEKITDHSAKCPNKCCRCDSFGPNFPCPDQVDNAINCKTCNEFFYNRQCYKRHLAITCKKFYRCPKCGKKERIKALRKLKKGEKPSAAHKCGFSFCKICTQVHDPKKGCVIKPIEPDLETKPYRIVSFDFETTQDTELEDATYAHKVNAAAAMVACTNCLDKRSKAKCNLCGPARRLCWVQGRTNDEVEIVSEVTLPDHGTIKQHTWHNVSDPLQAFVDWIITLDSSVVTYAYAHFGGRFDFHLLLRRMFKRNMTPQLTMVGLKIYTMTKKHRRCKIIFRDSYLLMQRKLSDLPATFNLKCENKHYFPYLFNKRSNYEICPVYKCKPSLPPLECYVPNAKKKDEREKLIQWYEKNRGTVFYLPEQLESYVCNDVEILMGALVQMRKLFIEACDHDILEKVSTIASACMRVFRSNHLEETTNLAVVPERGYERQDRQSNIAIKMLDWLAKEFDLKIRHAATGGEKQIKCKDHFYKLDGYVKKTMPGGEDEFAIEINGCLIHGCNKCYEASPHGIGLNGKTHEKNYELAKRREKELRKHLPVVVIWEHEIYEELKRNSEMKEFFENHADTGPINPRSCLKGGRCGPLSRFAKCGPGEQISVFDIVSLYPYVQYAFEYPTGVPTITNDNMEVCWTKPSDNEIKGLMTVEILPPKGTMIPAIGRKTEDGLLFASCYKCYEEEIQRKKRTRYIKNDYHCPHTDEQRKYVDTLTHVDVNLALDNGYKVTKLYRAWRYEKWDSNLFKDYIRTFLKIKVETSGWPRECDSEEKKAEFRQLYKDKFDIELGEIVDNPGLRHIVKLLL